MSNSHCQKVAFPAFPGSRVGDTPDGKFPQESPCVLHLEERWGVCSAWIQNLRALQEPWEERCGIDRLPGSAWAGSCGTWGAGCDEPKGFPALPTQEGQTQLDCGALAVSPIFPLGTAQEEPPGPFALPDAFTLTIPHNPCLQGQPYSLPLQSCVPMPSCVPLSRQEMLVQHTAQKAPCPAWHGKNVYCTLTS